MPEIESRAEITIHEPTSANGRTGWTVAFIRQEDESDDDYTQRTLAKHRELDNELRMKLCCGTGLGHDLDDCEQRLKAASRE